MATIVFDLDHTLLDTSRLSADITSCFVAAGVSPGAIDAAREFVTESNYGNYDPLLHAARLQDEGHLSDPSAVTAFLERPATSYLIEDAVDTLTTLVQAGYTLVLVTKGVESFQRWKIGHTGIAGFFSEIHICDDLKEEVLELRQAHLAAPIIFVNDNFHETLRIREALPALRYLLYVRPDASQFYDPDASPLPTVRALKDIPALMAK